MGGLEVGVERVEHGGGLLELGEVASVGDDREPGVGLGPDEAVASAARSAAALTAAAFREGRPGA